MAVAAMLSCRKLLWTRKTLSAACVYVSRYKFLVNRPNWPRVFADYRFSIWSVIVVSKMTYTVLSGTLNSTIPYHTIAILSGKFRLLIN